MLPLEMTYISIFVGIGLVVHFILTTIINYKKRIERKELEHERIIQKMDGKSVRFCPDLLVREERKAIAIGQGDVTFSYFQPCLLGKCIAYNSGACQKYGQSVREVEDGEDNH